MPGQLRKSFPEEMGPGGRMRNKKTVSKRKVPGEFSAASYVAENCSP